jgi:hypothetical protein
MDRAGQVQLRQEAGKLAGRAGTRITFGRGYSDSGLFLDRLDRMAVMVALPAAQERCGSGGDAQFADLTVSAAGIGWDACGAPLVPGPLPWTRPVNGTWP